MQKALPNLSSSVLNDYLAILKDEGFALEQIAKIESFEIFKYLKSKGILIGHILAIVSYAKIGNYFNIETILI